MTSRFYLNSSDKRTEEIDNYAYINRITSRVGLLGVTSVKFYKTNPSADYSYLRGDNITPVITLSY